MMKMPDYEQAEKCIAIRKRGKKSEHLSEEECRLCREMFQKFPEWYADTEERVFNETVPFGSHATFRRQ